MEKESDSEGDSEQLLGHTEIKQEIDVDGKAADANVLLHSNVPVLIQVKEDVVHITDETTRDQLLNLAKVASNENIKAENVAMVLQKEDGTVVHVFLNSQDNSAVDNRELEEEACSSNEVVKIDDSDIEELESDTDFEDIEESIEADHTYDVPNSNEIAENSERKKKTKDNAQNKISKRKGKKAVKECKKIKEEKHTHKEDFVECEKCTKKIAKNKIAKHKRLKHGEPMTCQYCGVVKESLAHLRQHEFNLHGKYKMLECEECEYKTKFYATMKRHKDIHKYKRGEIEKELQCEICEKTFMHAHNLKIHRLVHKEEKPFKCVICGKQFAQKNNWKLHVERHTKIDEKFLNIKDDGKPRFPCPDCGKLFRWNHDMKRHRKTIHLKVYKFQCSYCSKQFPDKSALDVHISRVHVGGKHFECIACPKKYNDKYRLSYHLNEKHGIYLAYTELEKMFGRTPDATGSPAKKEPAETPKKPDTVNGESQNIEVLDPESLKTLTSMAGTNDTSKDTCNNEEKDCTENKEDDSVAVAVPSDAGDTEADQKLKDSDDDMVNVVEVMII